MKWMVTVIDADSSVEQSTYDDRDEAKAYYDRVVSLSKERNVACKVHMTSVGQVLEFKRKEKNDN